LWRTLALDDIAGNVSSSLRRSLTLLEDRATNDEVRFQGRIASHG